MHLHIWNKTKEEWQAKVPPCQCVFLWFSIIRKGTCGCGTAKQNPRKLEGFIVVKPDTESVCASVPLHFVCKRLEVLNHLALLRWRGGGPASEGQEAIETQPVTHPEAANSQQNSSLLETKAVLRHHGWTYQTGRLCSYYWAKLSTFEAERRGVALAFCLVIGACGRACNQARKRGVKDVCWGNKRHQDQNTDIPTEQILDEERTKDIRWTTAANCTRLGRKGWGRTTNTEVEN